MGKPAPPQGKTPTVGAGTTAGRDLPNVLLLLALYTIQGIPMGLSGSIPYLMQGRVSYLSQGKFSLVSLPFSLKLVWAPLVDALYWQGVGRRKSWLLPVQFACGALMIWGGAAGRVEAWLGVDGVPDVARLSLFFGTLFFLMATQDIVVDGWALTMLRPENRKHASTCNTVGQAVGFFLAHVGFLALQDAETCNRWFRTRPEPHGLVGLSGFLAFWGWSMVLLTALTSLKAEESEAEEERNDSSPPRTPRRKHSFDVEMESRTKVLPQSGGWDLLAPPQMDLPGSPGQAVMENASGGCLRVMPARVRSASACSPVRRGESPRERLVGVVASYRQLWRLVALRPIQWMAVALLVCRAPFAATDAVTPLKLVEYGLPKERLAFMAPFLIPIGIASPLGISRLMNRYSPLTLFVWGFAARTVMSLAWVLALPITAAATADGTVPVWYIVGLFAVTAVYSIVSDLMFVSQIGFFAKVADPSIGGTYMTLLNTVANIGNKWPGTAALMSVDFFTRRECPISWEARRCPIVAEGYYRIVGGCCVAGAALWLSGRRRLLALEALPSQAWKVDVEDRAKKGD